ncbi:MAG: nucleotide sugar dehydrogenase [Desulfobacterales bacterium]|nr:nucleotide sugar dehydrogenase [Desulfobacterales bacterium]
MGLLEKSNVTLREQLLTGKKSIACWGSGFIGFSTGSHFAQAGVKVILVDNDPTIVARINAGEFPRQTSKGLVNFDIRPIVRSGKMQATTKWEKVISTDVVVHFICIPTEKDGKPWDEVLVDVIHKLCRLKGLAQVEPPPLLIIESTLYPGCTDKVIIPILEDNGFKLGEDILLGVAPRRDWFDSLPEKSLRSLNRVFGGINEKSQRIMENVLGLVCDNLVPAMDYRYAEMAKAVENSIRHVEITLANQLTLAYPEVDIAEVLRLAGTKWNIGTFHPSLGCGGYCIPIAGQYLLRGSDTPEELTLLTEAFSFDYERLPTKIAETLSNFGSKDVGILGLCYRPDIKVHSLSPTIRLTKALRKLGIGVKVHDPYYSDDEIRSLAGCSSFEFPDGLSKFDTIVIATGHKRYRQVREDELNKHLKNCRIILYNMDEIWKHFSLDGIQSLTIGEGRFFNARRSQAER